MRTVWLVPLLLPPVPRCTASLRTAAQATAAAGAAVPATTGPPVAPLRVPVRRSVGILHALVAVGYSPYGKGHLPMYWLAERVALVPGRNFGAFRDTQLPVYCRLYRGLLLSGGLYNRHNVQCRQLLFDRSLQSEHLLLLVPPASQRQHGQCPVWLMCGGLLWSIHGNRCLYRYTPPSRLITSRTRLKIRGSSCFLI